MKNLSMFLFVLSLCMINHVYGAGFRIANELKFRKNLNVSCHSGDDRFDPLILRPGQHWKRKFQTNVFGGTRFTCRLSQGPGYKHFQEFTSFKQISAWDNGGLWDWRARENGIYLKVWGHIHSQGEVNMHLEHKWIN